METEKLVEKSVSGLHAAVEERFLSQAKPGSAVLDLGAGSGAWARRLSSRGHKVTAVDWNQDGFSAKEVEFVRGDLNGDFASGVGRQFPLVTAIEVIEHLENPRHFLRMCHRLLEDGGRLCLTTPNIECVPGRLRFLMTGQFRMFDRDPALNDPTHITPIQTFMFERAAHDTGFEIVSHEFHPPKSIPTRLLFRPIASVVDGFLNGVKGGDAHIFVLKKSAT